MYHKNKLVKKIDEALASQSIDHQTKLLLLEIREELEFSNSYEDLLTSVIRIIELMGVFSELIN